MAGVQKKPEHRPLGDLDPQSALLPYRGPWTAHTAAHLLRRAGFGGSAAEIDAAVGAGMEVTVAKLVAFGPDELPNKPSGDLAFYGPNVTPQQRAAAFAATQYWWLDRMLRSPNPLQEKMVLFWSNHFTSFLGDKGITPTLMVRQIALFRRYALGNYANLTKEMTRDPAMLLYLDGAANRKQHPNENYARELMELFTLGIGNYSEQDIRESARAFTGYTLDRTGSFVFNARVHDTDAKTVLGHTGNLTGDDVVEIIMEQPATGRFIARKFLRTFVYDDPESVLVELLASRFRQSGYDSRSLMETLLSSDVFYSTRAYRALVKSPVELAIGAYKTLGIARIPPPTGGALSAMGQVLLRPPNVAGWPGGSLWLNSNTLLLRLNFLSRVAMFRAGAGGLAGAMMPSMAGQAGQLDPQAVADRVLDLVLQGDASSSQRQAIVDYLQSDGVGNKVALGPENIEEKLSGAISLAMAIPAYQLA